MSYFHCFQVHCCKTMNFQAYFFKANFSMWISISEIFPIKQFFYFFFYNVKFHVLVVSTKAHHEASNFNETIKLISRESDFMEARNKFWDNSISAYRTKCFKQNHSHPKVKMYALKNFKLSDTTNRSKQTRLIRIVFPRSSYTGGAPKAI